MFLSQFFVFVFFFLNAFHFFFSISLFVSNVLSMSTGTLHIISSVCISLILFHFVVLLVFLSLGKVRSLPKFSNILYIDHFDVVFFLYHDRMINFVLINWNVSSWWIYRHSKLDHESTDWKLKKKEGIFREIICLLCSFALSCDII